jgi:hypothetical protein
VSVPQTSGTYNFSPAMGETVLYCYGLCGIRNTALTQQHFETARMATNLLMAEWSARGVNLWQVDLQHAPLQKGVATYPVESNTIVILDAYIRMNSGHAGIDRLILPISRSEYSTYPNKHQEGFPTTYWMDRLLSPTVTLWPVPDSTVSAFKYYRLRQTQDSVLQNGTAIEMPIYFQNAFSLGLAWRLALTWAPTQVPVLKPLADEAYNFAASQNVETSQFYLSPMVGGYYR